MVLVEGFRRILEMVHPPVEYTLFVAHPSEGVTVLQPVPTRKEKYRIGHETNHKGEVWTEEKVELLAALSPTEEPDEPEVVRQFRAAVTTLLQRESDFQSLTRLTLRTVDPRDDGVADHMTQIRARFRSSETPDLSHDPGGVERDYFDPTTGRMVMDRTVVIDPAKLAELGFEVGYERVDQFPDFEPAPRYDTTVATTQ